MKTNTFYNPKNQYNELLASVPYVNAEDAAIDAKFTSEINRVDERIDAEIEDLEAADQNIHHKIDTLNTIKVKWVNAGRGDNKFSDIKEYFVSLIEPSSPYRKDIEELKVELGQTIYIIEGKDDSTTSLKTYEEWVCINPDFESHGEKYNNLNIPAMVRLGAVDSILAREDSPGSVQLIHNLYNEEDWSKYFATDYEGNVTHRPIKGEAVAPCALKAFVEADKEIIGSLELEIAARREAIEAEAAERKTSDTEIHEELNAHNTRLSHLEAEVEGKVSEVENEMGFSGSRLDRIEAAIGINHHHCENCGCDHQHCTCEDNKCSCSDADNKCTIYCRLNDAEKDREELNEAIFSIDKRLVAKAERLDLIEAAIGINHHHCENCGCEHEHCTCEDDKCSCSDIEDKCTIYCRLNDIEDDLETHMDTLESHNDRIENLESLTESHSTEIENLKAEDTDIRTDFTNEVSRLDERIENAKKYIESNKRYIQTVESILIEEKDRSIAEDNSLTVKIETESLARETSDNAIWSEIGEKTNAADGTIWKEIKEIQEEIGNQDEPYEDSIWIRIKNNKIVLDSEIARSTAADTEQVTRISDLESNVEEIRGEIGNKLSTDINIWHGIHTEINDRKSADSQLSKDIENALSNAKAYADELKTATLSEAAADAKNKADAAKEAAINTAANDANIKAADAKLEAKDYAKSYTDEAVDNLASSLRTEMAALETTCKEYTDGIAAETLSSAKDDAATKATAAKDAAINAAANDATSKAADAKSEAISTATENAKNYTDTSIRAIETSINNAITTCNTYTDNKVGILSAQVSADIIKAKEEAISTAATDATNKVAAANAENMKNIADAKNELITAINSKVNLSDFENITSNIETRLSSKASESDLSSTNLKVEILENNLENLSHGFQHINSQTQFAVRTSLPGKGSKIIQVYNLIGPASNEWDLVTITTVIANNDTIYPEITYSGNIDEGKNDNRTVSITFEHAGAENLPVTLIVSAFKASQHRIIEIN